MAPRSIDSKPTARATFAIPEPTAITAARNAVVPLAQAFSTLKMGMPVMPTPYSTFCPAVVPCRTWPQ